MSLYRWSKDAKEQTGNPWVPTDDTPHVALRDAWMPKGDLGYYDPSAKRHFGSRREKRQWLLQNKMREGGIINPDKRLEFGAVRNASKPSQDTRQAQARGREWVRAQGGTAGLLNRLQRGG